MLDLQALLVKGCSSSPLLTACMDCLQRGRPDRSGQRIVRATGPHQGVTIAMHLLMVDALFTSCIVLCATFS